MPDWRKLVRQRLDGLALDSGVKEEVHAEIAGHLEDAFEEHFRRGLPQDEAVQRTLAEVEDWQELRRRIQSVRIKENIMSNRVTQLWLPGLLTFALSMGFLELVQKFGPQPHILELDKGTPVLMFYTGWLLVLPLAGGVGAYLSKRAGGSLQVVLLSSIFSVLPFAVVFLIAIPIGLVMGHNLEHHIVAAAFLSMAIGWVLVPGAALLAGGLLVQLLFSRSLASRGISGH